MSDLPEGTKSFVEAVLLGGDVDEHEGLAVTAQGVLEQVRQLGVAVRYVRALHRRNRLKKVKFDIILTKSPFASYTPSKKQINMK
jgi:hypothetical protein